MRYELITAGKFNSITLEDARLHLREPSNITAEDDLVKSYIRAADASIEFKTNRIIASSTWKGHLDTFPQSEVIKINRFPVSSISSIQYYDSSNSIQTMSSSDYIVDTTGKVTRIYLEDTPSIYERTGAIIVNFVAGYTNQQSVDERIKQACRILVADYKSNRVDYVVGRTVNKLPRTVDYLINQLKIDVL